MLASVPHIANTLGWMTAELGRQPWMIYGLFRTSEEYSKVVSPGSAVFTLIGFVGLLALSFLVGREIHHGPEPHHIGAVRNIGFLDRLRDVDGRNLARDFASIVARTPPSVGW
jgi:hypothetical protein